MLFLAVIQRFAVRADNYTPMIEFNKAFSFKLLEQTRNRLASRAEIFDNGLMGGDDFVVGGTGIVGFGDQVIGQTGIEVAEGDFVDQDNQIMQAVRKTLKANCRNFSEVPSNSRNIARGMASAVTLVSAMPSVSYLLLESRQDVVRTQVSPASTR